MSMLRTCEKLCAELGWPKCVGMLGWVNRGVGISMPNSLHTPVPTVGQSPPPLSKI